VSSVVKIPPKRKGFRSKSTDRKLKVSSVCLSDDLMRHIEKTALANYRSISAEIRMRLERDHKAEMAERERLL
jgi:hypothetical protein